MAGWKNLGVLESRKTQKLSDGIDSAVILMGSIFDAGMQCPAMRIRQALAGALPTTPLLPHLKRATAR